MYAKKSHSHDVIYLKEQPSLIICNIKSVAKFPISIKMIANELTVLGSSSRDLDILKCDICDIDLTYKRIIVALHDMGDRR